MTNNNIVNKYGCIFEVEETNSNQTVIWAANADNTIQVKFAVQNLATEEEPEPYWRGQVDEYKIPDHDDWDRFISGVYGDLYNVDDESKEWVVENCLHEFYKWIRYIEDQREYAAHPVHF